MKYELILIIINTLKNILFRIKRCYGTNFALVHLIDYKISKYRYDNDISPKSKNKGLRYFPREIKWINPESIKSLILRLFSSMYFIQNGDWDKSIASIKDRPQYRVVDELLNKLYSIEDLTDYDFTQKNFDRFEVNRNKAEELTKKYSSIMELAEKIKKSGYKTQKELGLSSYNKFNTWYDEIRVSVTRNGEYILNGSGNIDYVLHRTWN